MSIVKKQIMAEAQRDKKKIKYDGRDSNNEKRDRNNDGKERPRDDSIAYATLESAGYVPGSFKR